MKTTELAIGMLRQHLNENCITDPKKMVTNAEIKHWLEVEDEFLNLNENCITDPKKMVTSEEIKHWLEIEDEFLIKKEKNKLLKNWLNK